MAATGPGWTRTGSALLGSISDDPYDIRTFVRAVRPADGYAHVGTELVSSTDRTLAERGYLCRAGETTRGVNEAGLAFTIAGVFEVQVEQQVERPEPLLFADLSERLMRECASVPEALDLLAPVPAAIPSWQLLLADAAGEIAQVEIGSRGVQVVARHSHDGPGIAVSVNCYVSEALEPLNDPPTLLANAENNNGCRLHRGVELAHEARGDVSVERLVAILSDHHNGDRDPLENPVLESWAFSICNHGTRRAASSPPEDLPWGTVSAEILDPEAGTLWYAYGWPCGGPPGYGDQYLQERSWGRFLPFSLDLVGAPEAADVVPLSTMWGDLLDPATGESIALDEFADRVAQRTVS